MFKIQEELKKMEKGSGNCEGNPGTGRRRMCFNADGDGVETMKTKFVKRRRRDHSAQAAAAVTSSTDQQQTGEQSAQGDQTPSATTVKRSSRFRGVSRHRWTGRYEAHLWDKGTWNPTQRKKGKQVYLGAYDEEESAARAYDLAALKYWGPSTFTNFPVSDYEKELEIMKTVTREEYLASLRRRSSGFSRGVSKYRGVARHHHNGRWEARIGRVFGNKYLYLGTYSTQEEAAHAYDIAAIEYRGINAVTNFDLSTYIRWLRPGSNPPDPQESKPALDPVPPTSPFSTHHNVLREKPSPSPTQFSFLQPSPYLMDHDLNTPKKEEDLFQRRPPISPSTKSSASPTALSLLLKSSVFKELVEKNLYTPNDENEEIDRKGLVDADKSSEVGEFLFSGVSHIPNMFPASRDTLPLLESKEEGSTLPLYNTTTSQSPFWNGALNLPPFH